MERTHEKVVRRGTSWRERSLQAGEDLPRGPTPPGMMKIVLTGRPMSTDFSLSVRRGTIAWTVAPLTSSAGARARLEYTAGAR